MTEPTVIRRVGGKTFLEVRRIGGTTVPMLWMMISKDDETACESIDLDVPGAEQLAQVLVQFLKSSQEKSG